MDKPFNNGLNVFIVVAATFIVQIVLALVISKLTCCTDLGTNIQIAGAICFAIVVIIEYFQHRKRRKAGENIPWWGWDWHYWGLYTSIAISIIIMLILTGIVID